MLYLDMMYYRGFESKGELTGCAPGKAKSNNATLELGVLLFEVAAPSSIISMV